MKAQWQKPPARKWGESNRRTQAGACTGLTTGANATRPNAPGRAHHAKGAGSRQDRGKSQRTAGAQGPPHHMGRMEAPSRRIKWRPRRGHPPQPRQGPQTQDAMTAAPNQANAPTIGAAQSPTATWHPPPPATKKWGAGHPVPTADASPHIAPPPPKTTAARRRRKTGQPGESPAWRHHKHQKIVASHKTTIRRHGARRRRRRQRLPPARAGCRAACLQLALAVSKAPPR